MVDQQLRFLAEAAEEAEAARTWYSDRDARVASGFLEELDHAVAMVLEAPQRWPLHVAGTRRYIFPRFPFSLVYREYGGVIEVIAVAHHKRKPGYWKSRD